MTNHPDRSTQASQPSPDISQSPQDERAATPHPPTPTPSPPTPNPQPLIPLLSLAFLLTALLGVWAAYDRNAAWARFGLLAVGVVLMLLIAFAGRRWGEDGLGMAGVACALLAGAIGGYFLLAYDWSAAGTTQVTLLQMGLWIQDHRPGVPLPEDVNANVAASGLVATWPLGLAGLAWAWQRRHRLATVIVAAALLVGLVALMLSFSRGAWLGLAAGAVAVVYLVLREWLTPRSLGRVALDGLMLLGVIALVAGLILVATQPQVAQLLGTVGVGDSAMTRPELWQDGLVLIGDYPFTGSGLGSTMMVYSTYGRFLHVGFIGHVHSLYLQIAIEQGVFGLLAFLGLMLLAGWNGWRACTAGSPSAISLAAVMALVALAVHSLVDVGAYGSQLLVVAFLPVGFGLGIRETGGRRRETGDGRWETGDGRRETGDRRREGRLVAAIVFVAFVALVLALPAGQAAVQANLGAVAQSRAELSAYTWPQWPVQDELRRTGAVDLGPAQARYDAALAHNPANVTANRRLGQIELSMGQYEAARQHLEAAYAEAPGQRATRQLLGESYAIEGDLARAAQLWQGVNLGEGQLQGRMWWYEHIGEPERAALIQEAMEGVGGEG